MEATMISEGILEGDEAVFPCKGCGEILEEGKAFELAGNRWHLDCFRCNSCRTLLDSDANLLLLGDGSLICNNCTYSCSVCKQKIEDLAILTGEKQAFCARCFRCRNCKRKIENLKYAKTSQGIFCMQCHESLMARRRKKNEAKAAAAAAAQRTPSSASNLTPLVEKSLPALPPHIATQALSPDTDLRSPPDGSANSGTSDVGPFSDFKIDKSTTPHDEGDTVLLSPRAYGDAPLESQSESHQDMNPEDDGFSIPVLLDPSPIQPPPRRRGLGPAGRDFFGAPQSAPTNFRNDFSDFLEPASRPESSDRQQSRSRGSPHPPYQEKGHLPSSNAADTVGRRNGSGSSTPASILPQSLAYSPADRSRFSPLKEFDDPIGERFKLQPAPKRTTSGTRGPDSSTEGLHVTSNARTSPIDPGSGYNPASGVERAVSPDLPFPKRKASFKRSPLASPSLEQVAFERPSRTDSMKKQFTQERQPQEEKEAKLDPPQLPTLQIGPQASIGKQEPVYDRPFAKNSLSASSPAMDKDGLPTRNPRRPLSGPMSATATPDGSREDIATGENQATPTRPGYELGHFNKGSVMSIQTDSLDFSRPESPAVSANNTFDPSPEDTQEGGKDGLLRSFSKAVRHARSQSDKIGTSPKWQKTRNVSVDISSPHPASSTEGENVDLRNKLRYSQQRITELEADKIALQVRMNGSEDIVQVNTELSQKRSTMAMIDSQREMVLRELEVMTDQLQKIKSNSGMVDIDQLRSDVMRDFGAALERLKMQVAEEVEELMAKKNDLTKEITDLIQMKDKGNQDYDSLSNRNRELARHNDQLIASIQSIYQQQAKSNGAGGSLSSQGGQNPYGGQTSNGLGIYAQNRDQLYDGRSMDGSTQYSGTAYSGDPDFDQGTVVSQPQFVNLRKGQPRKFISWKKGRETVAKNVTKGFKGAFGSTQNTLREETLTEGVPYGHIPATEPPPQTGTIPLGPARGGLDSKGHQGWGFKGGILGQPPARPLDRSRDTPPSSTVHTAPSSSTSATAASNALTNCLSADTNIFGSDLTARCEFEKRVIPSIVMSCIDEVSMRGLEEEGIYRKSGSSTQVKAIQAAFERDYANYDISDPDLDIHAITGCLKQYFRRLPNPLITFECYDAFLECVRDEGTSELQKVLMIKEVVTMLPKCHRETLEFLCFHLCGVMEKQSENLMTPLNLAVVFAPTIMRPLSIEREIADTTYQRGAVQVLLENFAAIFEPPESAT